jgi:hypothetical protein
MINFGSCFTIGKAQGWGTFPNCEAELGYCLGLGPLFSKCSHPWALPYTDKLPGAGDLMVSSLGQGENDIRKSATFDKCIWRGASFIILGKVMGTLVKALDLGFFGLISHGIMHWQELIPLYKLKAKPQVQGIMPWQALPDSQWCLIWCKNWRAFQNEWLRLPSRHPC